MPNQNTGNVRARCLCANSADLMCNGRHTIDHRGFLVLAYRIGALLPHCQKSGGTVLAHAGHDNAYHLAVHCFRHGLEQHINRWAMATDLSAGCAGERIFAANAHHTSL